MQEKQFVYDGKKIYDIEVEDQRINYITYSLKDGSRKRYFIDNILGRFKTFLKENNMTKAEFYEAVDKHAQLKCTHEDCQELQGDCEFCDEHAPDCTELNKENEILDNALDHYEKTLKNLVEHIDKNIETGKVDFCGDFIPYQVVRIDQTAMELINEAKQLLKQD